MKITYDEMFSRNIGVFTKEEQEKIKNLKVAIAGTGGLGGAVAYMLARLGVGYLRLADPDNFEASNINRQFGAYVDTLGVNKAKAIKSELLRINPNIIIDVFESGVSDSNAEKFVKGVDCVVDGIDFYSFKEAISLHSAASKDGKWVLTAQVLYSMVSTLNFSPNGKNFSDLYVTDGAIDLGKILKTNYPKTPDEVSEQDVSNFLSGAKKDIPSWSHGPMAIALFLVEDLIRLLVKNEQLLAAPSVTLIDLKNMKIERVSNGDK